MAKKKNKQKGKTAQKARPVRRRTSGRGGLHALIFMFSVMALGLLVFAPAAIILFVIGMVPTAVAIIIDREPQKYTSISVAATNFAGLSPYLASLLFGSASFSRAIELAADVFVLVVIYGAAAAGWVLVLVVPQATAFILRVTTDNRIQSLRKEQEKLIEDWGEAVTGR